MFRVQGAEGSTEQQLQETPGGQNSSSEVLDGICGFSDIKYGSKLCGECQTLLESSLAVSTPSEGLDVSVSSEKHMPRLQFVLLQNKPVLALFCHLSLIYLQVVL